MELIKGIKFSPPLAWNNQHFAVLKNTAAHDFDTDLLTGWFFIFLLSSSDYNAFKWRRLSSIEMKNILNAVIWSCHGFCAWLCIKKLDLAEIALHIIRYK